MVGQDTLEIRACDGGTEHNIRSVFGAIVKLEIRFVRINFTLFTLALSPARSPRLTPPLPRVCSDVEGHQEGGCCSD